MRPHDHARIVVAAAALARSGAAADQILIVPQELRAADPSWLKSRTVISVSRPDADLKAHHRSGSYRR
jgi:hypothetical protein